MRILVTGASGTLGRFVCRDLLKGNNEVVAYSRDHSRQLQYCQGCEHVVGDIQDYCKLAQAMEGVDGVVHTAAVKHVDICEASPSLAVGTIVGGTENVLRAVENFGIDSAVFMSTDKACNRNQVYGLCKHLMELLVGEYRRRTDANLVSVRLGNIFGSQGSVISLWNSRMAAGEDLELRVFGVKNEAATRFATHPSEAARHVVSALTHRFSASGVVIPMVSRVVNMRTVAEAMVELSGKDVKIVEKPALEGESRFERMVSKDESYAVDYEQLKQGIHLMDVKKVPNSYDFDFGGNDACMDKEATKKFLNTVLEEMSWT